MLSYPITTPLCWHVTLGLHPTYTYDDVLISCPACFLTFSLCYCSSSSPWTAPQPQQLPDWATLGKPLLMLAPLRLSPITASYLHAAVMRTTYHAPAGLLRMSQVCSLLSLQNKSGMLRQLGGPLVPPNIDHRAATWSAPLRLHNVFVCSRFNL
jgi:hypothetical protein